jgi:hypothetical protein
MNGLIVQWRANRKEAGPLKRSAVSSRRVADRRARE